MWRKFADHEGTGEGSLQAEGSFLYISRLQSVVGVDSKRKYHFTQKLGIDAYENRFPDEISGGEQQRAAIARAVLKHSRVLLADEPTGSLDMHTARNVLELFEEINRDYHVTVVMVTHDVFSASFCNRIIFLKDGKFTNEIEKSGFQQDFYKIIQKEMREMDGIF